MYNYTNMRMPKSNPMERPDPKELTPKEWTSPEELLWKKGWKNYSIQTMKEIKTILESNDNADKTKNFEIRDDYVKSADYVKPTLSLQWEIDFDTVTEWMANHMKAYPETQRGFYAEF